MLLEAHGWPCFYSTLAIFPPLSSVFPEPPRQEPTPLTWIFTGRKVPRNLSASTGVGSPWELNSVIQTQDSFSYILTSEPSFLQQKESTVSTLAATEAQASFLQGVRNIFERRKLKNRIRPHLPSLLPILLWNLLSNPAGLFTVAEHIFSHPAINFGTGSYQSYTLIIPQASSIASSPIREDALLHWSPNHLWWTEWYFSNFW